MGVWAVVVTNSIMGMVISFIFKHGDNIVKLFGASLGVLVTAAASSWLFGFHAGPALWLGYALAACSLCLYYGDKRFLYGIDSEVLCCCHSRWLPGNAREDPKIV